MKKASKRRITIAIALIITAALASTMLFVFAHPGGTDYRGGHKNHATGEYHYHHGYSAHQHYDMDGDGYNDCPYTFTPSTSHSAASSSASYSSSSQSSSKISISISDLPSYDFPSFSFETPSNDYYKAYSSSTNISAQGNSSNTWISIVGILIIVIAIAAYVVIKII